MTLTKPKGKHKGKKLPVADEQDVALDLEPLVVEEAGPTSKPTVKKLPPRMRLKGVAAPSNMGAKVVPTEPRELDEGAEVGDAPRGSAEEHVQPTGRTQAQKAGPQANHVASMAPRILRSSSRLASATASEAMKASAPLIALGVDTAIVVPTVQVRATSAEDVEPALAQSAVPTMTSAGLTRTKTPTVATTCAKAAITTEIVAPGPERAMRGKAAASHTVSASAATGKAAGTGLHAAKKSSVPSKAASVPVDDAGVTYASFANGLPAGSSADRTHVLAFLDDETDDQLLKGAMSEGEDDFVNHGGRSDLEANWKESSDESEDSDSVVIIEEPTPPRPKGKRKEKAKPAPKPPKPTWTANSAFAFRVICPEGNTRVALEFQKTGTLAQLKNVIFEVMEVSQVERRFHFLKYKVSPRKGYVDLEHDREFAQLLLDVEEEEFKNKKKANYMHNVIFSTGIGSITADPSVAGKLNPDLKKLRSGNAQTGEKASGGTDLSPIFASHIEGHYADKCAKHKSSPCKKAADGSCVILSMEMIQTWAQAMANKISGVTVDHPPRTPEFAVFWGPAAMHAPGIEIPVRSGKHKDRKNRDAGEIIAEVFTSLAPILAVTRMPDNMAGASAGGTLAAADTQEDAAADLSFQDGNPMYLTIPEFLDKCDRLTNGIYNYVRWLPNFAAAGHGQILDIKHAGLKDLVNEVKLPKATAQQLLKRAWDEIKEIKEQAPST